MSTDPFTLLHNAIQDEVLASHPIKLAVKNYKHNIIDSNDKRLQQQDVTTTSDTPELILKPTSHSGQILLSSSTVGFQHGLTWFVHTGDRRPSEAVYPITFALSCVLTEICFGQKFRQLSWQGNPFVFKAEFESADHDSDGDPERGIAGYSSLFTIMCDLQFPRESLLKYHKGEPIE